LNSCQGETQVLPGQEFPKSLFPYFSGITGKVTTALCI